MTQALVPEECPDENALLDFASGALDDAAREKLEAHVADCADCCLVLGETARSISPDRGPIAEPLTLSREVAGRYELLREIGSGGQGRVFAAFDHQLQREVALKVPMSEERERFLREAQLAARLDHPGIVTVYEIGTRADGSLYSTQRLVRSEHGEARPRTLRDAFTGAATAAARVALLPRLISVAEAVAYAHGQSVVHHDLKPENVALGEHGETVVLDWGLAQELAPAWATGASQSVRGTPGYMSPEQARGLRGDSTSDVFALGAMLYELLSGKRPTTTPAPPLRSVEPTVPPALASIAERALAVDPAARYPDASGFAADLSSWLSGGMVQAYDYALRERIGLSLRRHRQVIAFGAVVAGVLLVAASILFGQNQRTRTALAQTLQEKGAAAQRRSAWDTGAALFAAALRLSDSDFARYGLSATLGHSRVKARVAPPGVSAVAALATSADGNQIAVGSQDGRILLYGRTGATPLRELAGHRDVIKALAFGPDSQTLVSGADDGKLLLWDLKAGTSRQLFQSPTPVNAVAVAPDGTWVAAGTESGVLGRWSVPGGEELGRWQAHTHPLYGLAVNPAGDTIASGGWDSTVKLWALAGELRATLTGHTESVLAVAYAPGGTLASASRDTTLRIWPADGSVSHVLTGHTQKVNAIAWINDHLLASTGDDALVRYWNLEDFSSQPSDNEWIDEDGLALRLSGDRLLVAGGRGVIASLVAPPMTFQFPLYFNHLDLDADGRLLALTTQNRLSLDANTYEVKATSRLEDIPRDVRPVPGGGLAVTTYPESSLKWVPPSGPSKRLVNGGQLTGLAVTEEAQIAVGLDDSTVQIFAPPYAGPPMILLGHTSPVFDIAFTSDRIFTASYDKTIGVYERKTGKRLAALVGHWSGVRVVAVSPDRKRVASGGWDKTVRIWDVEPPRLVKTLIGHEGYVTALDFDASGKRLVSSGWDGKVIIWDVERGEPLVTLATNEQKLRAARFLGSDRVLAAGSKVFSFTYTRKDPDEVLRSLARERGTVLEDTNVALVPFGEGLLAP